MTEQNSGGGIYSSRPTELGEQGEVDYGSQAFEDSIALRLKQLTETGRPANRQSVIRELVNSGRVRTQLGGNHVAELVDALPDRYKQPGGDTQLGAQGRVVRLEDHPAVVALADDPGVRALADQVRRTAEQRGISKAAALGEAWAAEGYEQGRRNPVAWAAVAAQLGVELP
jgi:hypothetical protein